MVIHIPDDASETLFIMFSMLLCKITLEFHGTEKQTLYNPFHSADYQNLIHRKAYSSRIAGIHVPFSILHISEQKQSVFYAVK